MRLLASLALLATVTAAPGEEPRLSEYSVPYVVFWPTRVLPSSEKTTDYSVYPYDDYHTPNMYPQVDSETPYKSVLAESYTPYAISPFTYNPFPIGYSAPTVLSYYEHSPYDTLRAARSKEYDEEIVHQKTFNMDDFTLPEALDSLVNSDQNSGRKIIDATKEGKDSGEPVNNISFKTSSKDSSELKDAVSYSKFFGKGALRHGDAGYIANIDKRIPQIELYKVKSEFDSKIEIDPYKSMPVPDVIDSFRKNSATGNERKVRSADGRYNMNNWPIMYGNPVPQLGGYGYQFSTGSNPHVVVTSTGMMVPY